MKLNNISGPCNSGKTAALVATCYNYARKGNKCLLVSLEVSINDVYRMVNKEISQPEETDEFIRFIKYEAGVASLPDVILTLDGLKSEGFTPDIIFIDSPLLFVSNPPFDELQDLAIRTNTPIWITTQTSRWVK